MNEGNGEFTLPNFYYIGQYCTAFHCGDIDYDNDLDIIACSYGKPFLILLNDGRGFFSDIVSYSQYYKAAYLVDVDDDGYGELIGLSDDARLEVIPFNQGQIPELPYYGGGGYEDIVAGDFNGDGNTDLAGSGNYSYDITILTNTGGGEFEVDKIDIFDFSSRKMLAVDIEGDNDLDLLVENGLEEELIILLNDGTGSLLETGEVFLLDDPDDIVADDFDEDGDSDLAYSMNQVYSGHSIAVMHNTGNNVFEHQMDLNEGLDYCFLCNADFDGDGNIDLAASYYGGIAITFNTGGGLFGSSILYPVDSASIILDTGDYDNDGDVDIVAAQYIQGGVWLLSNNGDGTFQKISGGSIEGRLLKVSFLDADNDGDQDIAGACCELYQSDMAILINDGNSFLPAKYYGGCDYIFTSADLDNDGDIDIASNLNRISILFNRSDILTDVHEEEIPESHKPEPYLSQNFPNPFNPVTQIEYSIPRRSYVTLHIYNTLGQKVITLVDDLRAAGMHRVLWDGKDAYGQSVSSGIYFYQLSFDNVIETKKMIMLK